MKIISISFSHNSTVGYFENGICKNIFHEEKFNNIKNFQGFPQMALDYCISKNNINPQELDNIIFFTEESLPINNSSQQTKNNLIDKTRNIYNFLEYKTGSKLLFEIKNTIFHLSSIKSKKILENFLFKKYKINKEKILYYDHHTIHALTPVYFYGLDKKDYLLITLDGSGNGSCSKIFIYKHKTRKLKLIANSSFFSSLGLLYTEMTKFLGMKPMEHEYKVMGLAAYVSNPKYYNHIYEKLKKIIWIDKKTLEFKSKFSTYEGSLYFKENFSMERFDNLSAAIQKLTEELTIEYIKLAVKKTGIKDIALSGGVFMNVKMNQKIINLKEINSVHFQPSCGDESTVIGAAAKNQIDNNQKIYPIKTMYLGPKYDNQEIEDFIKKKKLSNKYDVEYIPNINKKLSDLLVKFEVVAITRGNGEWGARSLGNRSILANASNLKTFYEINDMIKMRDFWMPFAPVILEEWAEKYIIDWKNIKQKAYESSKYMIFTVDSTKLAQEHLRAAIHQKDMTLRPQILNSSDNNSFYQLLKNFESKTKMGGLLNTSLNIHGYPLVNTLDQTLFTFENSKLKYLAMENWLITKK